MAGSGDAGAIGRLSSASDQPGAAEAADWAGDPHEWDVRTTLSAMRTPSYRCYFQYVKIGLYICARWVKQWDCCHVAGATWGEADPVENTAACRVKRLAHLPIHLSRDYSIPMTYRTASSTPPDVIREIAA